MPFKKFSDFEISRIKTFLELGWSFSVIQRKLREEGKSISIAYLSKLKHAKNRLEPSSHAKAKRRRAFRVFSPSALATLRRLISGTDPPSQRELALRFHCSPRAVRNAIKRLGCRLVKKPNGHKLTQSVMEKRRRRSWPLYRRLRCDRWQKFITSDEAWFYLSDTGRKRSVQYISRGKKRSDAEVKVHEAHPKGVMVWVAISAKGISRPLFVAPGAKIDQRYYQKEVLEPFFDQDAKEMFPDGGFVFHQDSAPSHQAKTTIKWFETRKISIVYPSQWMPSSPDASPCDYFLWGHLKNLLNKKRPRTVEGLKKAIAACLKEIPQETVNRALKAWPKRCRMINYARGGHIEKFMQ